MIDKIIDTVSNSLTLEHTFNPEDMQIVTTTTIAGREIHKHLFDLEPIYEAFKAKLEASQWPNS